MHVHALQHVRHEGPGAVADWAEDRGHGLTVVRLDGGEPLPDSADVDLLVVLGGPMGVYDDDAYPFLAAERELIRTVHARDDGHVLGICLGAQQLAAALGAPVGPHGDSEIGWFPISATPEARDSPIAPLGDSYAPLHWHGDSFAVPEGATLLATSEACHTQAFAVDGSLGLQFHLEVRPRDVTALVEATEDWPDGPWVQSPECIEAGGAYERLNRGLFEALDRLVDVD